MDIEKRRHGLQVTHTSSPNLFNLQGLQEVYGIREAHIGGHGIIAADWINQVIMFLKIHEVNYII
jgi:hypothetical protein